MHRALPPILHISFAFWLSFSFFLQISISDLVFGALALAEAHQSVGYKIASSELLPLETLTKSKDINVPLV